MKCEQAILGARWNLSLSSGPLLPMAFFRETMARFCGCLRCRAFRARCFRR